MDVLNPIRRAPAAVRALATRPSSLAGRRIAVLDNSKPNAGVLLSRVAEALVARHGARSISRWQKPGASRPATVLDEIARVANIVLTGSAD
jgi:hypothetical protein